MMICPQPSRVPRGNFFEAKKLRPLTAMPLPFRVFGGRGQGAAAPAQRGRHRSGAAAIAGEAVTGQGPPRPPSEDLKGQGQLDIWSLDIEGEK